MVSAWVKTVILFMVVWIMNLNICLVVLYGILIYSPVNTTIRLMLCYLTKTKDISLISCFIAFLMPQI